MTSPSLGELLCAVVLNRTLAKASHEERKAFGAVLAAVVPVPVTTKI